MDPATIGATVVTILAPYVADAGKEVVKAAGELGLQKAKSLLAWLKEQFADDPVATSDLSRFEKNPEAFAPGLEATIAKKAEDDKNFSAEITNRVNDLAPVLTVIQNFRDARDMTGIKAGTVRRGELSSTQGGETAANVTGIDVGTVE
jgi:hypothetical protein